MKWLRLLSFALASLLILPAALPQGKKSADARKSGAAARIIDINSASADELKKLPGIGDAWAERIIRNRPYRGKNEIVSKAGVPQATYDKIRDLIVAHQGRK